jgi:hypothetical protein
MWPVKVQRQFDIAQAIGNDALENVLHAPYNKLLNTLFPVDTDFTVIPNFQEINSTKGTDYLVTFEIFLENRPVFVLELKREKDFSVRSKRTAADDQLRGRLGDLIGNTLLPLFSISSLSVLDACPLPVLHGVSAFGIKLCFYSITKAGLVSPEYIPTPTQYVTDTAPVGRWNYDILTAEGEAELRRIVQVITTECAQLPQ